MNESCSTISIIGSGRVGQTVGEGFKELGHSIVFHDVDQRVVDKLKNLEHEASLDLEHVINHSWLSFICVAPTSREYTDLNWLIPVIAGVAHALRNKQSYHLVTIKSTILPETTERVIIPLLTNSGRRLGDDFGICINPEFGTEVAQSWTEDPQYYRDFFTQDRIVIGELDSKSGQLLEELYVPLQKPIFRTDLRTAEMVKYAANLMLATKVSFWNELFLICRKLAIDPDQVANIVALDPRIGKYGSVPGKAFGGKCLPKDLEGFISFAGRYHSPALLKAAKRVNDYMSRNYGIRE